MAPVSSFINGHLIWLGHVMCRNMKNRVRAVLEWKPTRKRPREWPKKRRLDAMEEELKKIGIQEWRMLVQNREK